MLQLAVREVGYAFGHHKADVNAAVERVGVVVTSMLGLLAFVLGLTLVYANTRFQERRLGTLAEAHSIGTLDLDPATGAGLNATSLGTLTDKERVPWLR